MSHPKDRSGRNPLLPALLGAVVVAYFDARFYFFQRQLPAIGIPVITSLLCFVILFFLRSRYAWHIAFVDFAGVLPTTLFITYHGGYMGFPLTWRLAMFDVVIYTLVATYIWRVRESYFRHASAKIRG